MTRKTEGGKGDRIPGANQPAYEQGYEAINWNTREEALPRVFDGEGDSKEGAED